MKLNLTAVDSSQEKILAYLQQNASESLAEKINNGTPFTKDNVQLINKKDLTSFMSYAINEARKLAKNGASYVCIDDSTVFGWAIHYFEEDSIEGKLYNPDGTEYSQQLQKQSSKKTLLLLLQKLNLLNRNKNNALFSKCLNLIPLPKQLQNKLAKQYKQSLNLLLLK